MNAQMKALKEQTRWPESAEEATADNLIRQGARVAMAMHSAATVAYEAWSDAEDGSETEKTLMGKYLDEASRAIAESQMVILLKRVQDEAPDLAEKLAREVWELTEDGGALDELMWDYLDARGIDSQAVFEAAEADARSTPNLLFGSPHRLGAGLVSDFNEGAIIKPIPVAGIVRAVGVDLDTMVAMGEQDGCSAVRDHFYCDLDPGHEGPHESRVPALVTLARWGGTSVSSQPGSRSYECRSNHHSACEGWREIAPALDGECECECHPAVEARMPDHQNGGPDV